MSSTFRLSDKGKELLTPQALDDFSVLLTGDIGEVLSVEPGREVRKLTVGDPHDPTLCFLKRRDKESPFKLLFMLIFGHAPRSGPLREQLMVKRLHAAGFAAMEPLAWGETRRAGLPTRGFILTRGISGRDFAQVFDQATGKGKLLLMRRMGNLVGRLHAAGFFHPVRLKDLILSSRQDDGELVLIDRETSKPWRKFWFTRTGCIRSLARATRRTLRDGHRLGPGSSLAFLKGYREGIAPRWEVSLNELRSAVLQAVRKELKTGRRKKS